MSVNNIQMPFATFVDLYGEPLESGYIYIGQAGFSAESMPITVYWDAALTIPAAQPVRTIAGLPVYLGSPGNLYVDGDYSITVKDKLGQVVMSSEFAATVASEKVTRFDTLAELKASESIAVGDVVQTLGYYTAGDGGGNIYHIVAAATGTEDGGTYIDLNGISAQAFGKFPDGWMHIKQYGAIGDANRLTGTGTDNSDIIQAALNTQHKNILIDAGCYRVTKNLLNLNEFRTIRGMGMGVTNLAPLNRGDFNPVSCILATGTGPKRVITRRKYRASAVDPNDPPLAAVFENWGGGCQFFDFSIELFCDYTDASPTNYGANWDIGWYNGCRGYVGLTRVSVFGYFRWASFYWDVTDAFGIPQLLDPAGNPLPSSSSGGPNQWTVRASGADGCGMSDCHCMGGAVGVALLGANSSRTGAAYYDWVTNATYPDDRGLSGASDFRTPDCTIHSAMHHSGYRLNDPSTMDFAGIAAQPDNAECGLYIDGWASNGTGVDGPANAMRGILLNFRRVVSWGIFRIRLGQCKEVYMKGRAWVEAGDGLYTVRSTTGAVVSPSDYTTFTYGPVCTNEYTGRYIADDSVLGIFQNYVYNWDWTKISDRQDRERRTTNNFAQIADDTNVAFIPTRPGGFMAIMFGGIGNEAPISQNSAFIWYDRGSTPAIVAAGFTGANFQIVAPNTLLSNANVTDGNIGISAHEGFIQMRNRSGSSAYIAWREL